jgi:hypothetical protein
METLDKLKLSDVVKQLHIIVGDGGRCMCGVYDATAITCADILSSKSEDIRVAIVMANCGGTRIRPSE